VFPGGGIANCLELGNDNKVDRSLYRVTCTQWVRTIQLVCKKHACEGGEIEVHNIIREWTKLSYGLPSRIALPRWPLCSATYAFFPTSDTSLV
jgi:hypothetical protein